MAGTRAELETALKAVLAASGAGVTAEQQAVRLADAIATWLAGVPVQVTVGPTAVGLQTTTSPGSPTGAPAVPVLLTGQLVVG